MSWPPGDDQRPDAHRPLFPAGTDRVAALCSACHGDVSGVDGVVLAARVAYAGWIILSDSGPGGDRLEDLHSTLGEGPRVDAVTLGELVVVTDLAGHRARARWPRFAAHALAGGIRAVFAFPVRLGTEPVGVLYVYRAAPGPVGATDRARIGRYAHTASVLLRHDAHLTGAGMADLPLPAAAGEVQQAVGIVMEHAAVDAITALHRLRVHARRSRRPMREVVTEIRSGLLPFDPTTP